MVLIVWELDLQLPMQTMSMTTNVVSLNPDHGDVYSIIHHYVTEFVSDCGFLQVLRFPPPIKLIATV